jgi:hypothetical protein
MASPVFAIGGLCLDFHFDHLLDNFPGSSDSFIHAGLNAMKQTPEDDTQWLKNKTGHFSFLSTLL